MKKIEINGEVFYFKLNHGIFYPDTVTDFYSLQSYTKRKKYFIFGKQIEVPVYNYEFTVYMNIENPKYSAAEVRRSIERELIILNRKRKIEKGNII